MTARAQKSSFRSGHSVCESPDTQREVIRILHLELNREKCGTEALSFAQR